MTKRVTSTDREMTVVVHVSTGEAASSPVRGRIETPYGARTFHGWLDLLGQLEALVERAQASNDDAP